jgi:hypothetical protein
MLEETKKRWDGKMRPYVVPEDAVLVMTAWDFGRQEVSPNSEYLRKMAEAEKGKLKELLLEYADAVEKGVDDEKLSELSGAILGVITKRLREVVE